MFNLWRDLPPGRHPPEEITAVIEIPFIATAAYGVAANVCYTGGWIVENLVERWLKRPAYGMGPALFRHGLVFSIGLTLLPAAVITVAAIGGLFFAGR